MRITTPEDVLSFWFGSPVSDAADGRARMRRWFIDGPALDAEVRERFGEAVEAALRGELDGWMAEGPRGRLALVIVLDQLTRHTFRGTPRTWSGDAKAQALVLETIDRGLDAQLDYIERMFLGMPLAHSEDLAIQRRSVEYGSVVTTIAPPHLAELARAHREQMWKYYDIIARFGRFPFRNAVLGRTTTARETEFLAEFTLQRHAPRALAEA
jgi:uncharacterized protein (DUF924 family)